MNNTFKLGRSIVHVVPFNRIPIKKEKQQKEIITMKMVIIMASNSDSKDCCFSLLPIFLIRLIACNVRIV